MSRGRNRNQQGGKSRGRQAQAVLLDVPVAKNDDVEIEIIGLTHEGEGVGRVDGYILFVHGALPGELVRAKVLKVKKQYGYAKLLEIVSASPERVGAPCEVYKQCGGCQLQHWSYEAQLEWKRQHVIDNLERIGKLKVAGGKSVQAGKESVQGKDQEHGHEQEQEQEYEQEQGQEQEQGIVVHSTLGMSEPWRYRNKAQVPMGQSEEGGLIGGFYARNSHRIIDMDACLIQHEQNDELVRRVKAIGQQLGVTAYSEETGEGLLRHVVVRVAFRTGELMAVLVTNGRKLPQADAWVEAIREQVPGVTSICQNVNTKKTNVILGDETKTLWGNDVIYDYIGNVKFAISARSFYQVNPVQTEVLYGKTLEYAGLTGGETVIDAYCGIGTISLFLAQHAKRVYGVEIVPEAIEDARANAALNGIANAEFAVGAAEDVMPGWLEQGISPDVIVVDPPRKGCDGRLLDTLLLMKPERIVYVSCNPATLARDLRVLADGGYAVQEVQPVDMFPHTVHVEAVCSLIYKGVDNK